MSSEKGQPQYQVGSLFLVLPKLTNKTIALVLASCGVPGQRTRLDLAKGFKHTLDVIIRQVLMYRGHVDAVESPSLLSQLVYDGLSLPYVAGSAYLKKAVKNKAIFTTSLGLWLTAFMYVSNFTKHSTTALVLTLMFLPPSITEFICSKASCAASGTSYSTKAKP